MNDTYVFSSWRLRGGRYAGLWRPVFDLLDGKDPKSKESIFAFCDHFGLQRPVYRGENLEEHSSVGCPGSLWVAEEITKFLDWCQKTHSPVSKVDLHLSEAPVEEPNPKEPVKKKRGRPLGWRKPKKYVLVPD